MQRDLISPTELARRLEVSRQAVHKAICQGRISQGIIRVSGRTKKQFWLDPEIAQQEFLDSSNTYIQEQQDDSIPTLAQSRSELAYYKAKLLELDYGIKIGKLLNKQEVEDAVFKASIALNNKLLYSLPHKIAIRAEGLCSAEIEQIIINELSEALEEYQVALSKTTHTT